jgi:hypothetical protein
MYVLALCPFASIPPVVVCPAMYCNSHCLFCLHHRLVHVSALPLLTEVDAFWRLKLCITVARLSHKYIPHQCRNGIDARPLTFIACVYVVLIGTSEITWTAQPSPTTVRLQNV